MNVMEYLCQIKNQYLSMDSVKSDSIGQMYRERQQLQDIMDYLDYIDNKN